MPVLSAGDKAAVHGSLTPLGLDEGAVRFAQGLRGSVERRWPGWGNLLPLTRWPGWGNLALVRSCPSARRRMVLQSTPVSRAISRWLVPVASSVATVVRLFGFKTFTLHAPLRWSKGQGCVLPAGLLSVGQMPYGSARQLRGGGF